DKAAVSAAISSGWSNGQTEGQICMCGWPPWRKGFVGGFDVGSAASMCPAYNWRPQPLALMRSADRVPDQAHALEALAGLLVVPISSIDRRVITSISADAPQPPACVGSG